jgi:hypothetical protein
MSCVPSVNPLELDSCSRYLACTSSTFARYLGMIASKDIDKERFAVVQRNFCVENVHIFNCGISSTPQVGQ